MADNSMRSVRPWRILMLGVAAATLAGCDGTNAFQSPVVGGGGGAAGAGPDVEILKPSDGSAKPVGDSLEVSVRVRSGNGIDQLVFSGAARRGDPNLGTEESIPRFETKTVDLNAPTDTTVRRFLQPTPETERDTAFVVVTATDLQGNESADTVRVYLGGPEVELLNLQDGTRVTAGAPLSLEMAARDPEGLTLMRFVVVGAGQDTTVFEEGVSPVAEADTFRAVYDIPSAARGDIVIFARAVNQLGVVGEDFATVIAGEGNQSDPTPPSLQVSVFSEERMELSDSSTVVVSGRDNDQGRGVAIVGYTIFARSAHAGEAVATDSVVFSTPRTGTVSQTFQVPIVVVDSLALPDTVRYEVTAFMIDGAGNCAAAVSDSSQQLTCAVEDGVRIAAGPSGAVSEFQVIAGRTVEIPSGGRIMDAVVDTLRRNLFLSNLDRNQVEVFRLQSETFLPPIAVGSEPWGLTLNRPTGGSPDTLLVANSGGTNITNVYLGGADGSGPFVEDATRRFLMPDVILWDVERTTDEFGALRLIPRPIPLGSPGFSDRPQFLAVDNTGTILLSTKETLLGDVGTIRKAYGVPGGRPEVVMFTEHGCCEPNANFTAIANIDRVTVVGGGSEVQLTDHLPGFPDQQISVTSFSPLNGADLLAQQLSDVQAYGNQRFSLAALGFSDTTYVTASGNGAWVVFGEGSVSPAGRVIMYDAAAGGVSEVVTVRDLMINASETVRGIGLNWDGSLGVARGDQAYFFTRDLRLQGVAAVGAGGGGAALHPLHANAPSIDNASAEYRPDTHMAFVGTGSGTIEIIDTFHFFTLGSIAIQDRLAGPLRAVLPFPEDNAGRSCQLVPVLSSGGAEIGQAVEIFSGGDFNLPHPAAGGPSEDSCVVVKLFGITDAGGVVVVDVRKGDILRNHPARR